MLGSSITKARFNRAFVVFDMWESALPGMG